VQLDRVQAGDVAHGRPLPLDTFVGPGPFALVDPAGELVAVYEADPAVRTARPVVVLRPASVPGTPTPAG